MFPIRRGDYFTSLALRANPKVSILGAPLIICPFRLSGDLGGGRPRAVFGLDVGDRRRDEGCEDEGVDGDVEAEVHSAVHRRSEHPRECPETHPAAEGIWRA